MQQKGSVEEESPRKNVKKEILPQLTNLMILAKQKRVHLILDMFIFTRALVTFRLRENRFQATLLPQLSKYEHTRGA
jgi:hypothetical protein